jgi:WD40 repeat protein
VIVWDAENGRKEAVLIGHNGRVNAMAFSPDGESLASGDRGSIVMFWDLARRQPRWMVESLHPEFKTPNASYCLAISPDGSEVASASDDQTMALWDVRKRQLITRIGTHTAPVLSVAWSPDGKRPAAGGHDKSVRLYTRHRTLWGRRLD